MDAAIDSQKDSKVVEILNEIKEAEKKSEEMAESAKREKETILGEAAKEAAKLLSSKENAIRSSREKQLADFRDKLAKTREEKLDDGRSKAGQAEAKSEKNMQKAVDFVMKKFEEMI